MGSFTSTEAFEQAPEWFDREGLRRAEYKGTGFVGKWADITTWFLKLSKIPPMQVGLSQCLWPHPYCHSLKEIGKCKVASKHFHPSLGARILNPESSPVPAAGNDRAAVRPVVTACGKASYVPRPSTGSQWEQQPMSDTCSNLNPISHNLLQWRKEKRKKKSFHSSLSVLPASSMDRQ